MTLLCLCCSAKKQKKQKKRAEEDAAAAAELDVITTSSDEEESKPIAASSSTSPSARSAARTPPHSPASRLPSRFSSLEMLEPESYDVDYPGTQLTPNAPSHASVSIPQIQAAWESSNHDEQLEGLRLFKALFPQPADDSGTVAGRAAAAEDAAQQPHSARVGCLRGRAVGRLLRAINHGTIDEEVAQQAIKLVLSKVSRARLQHAASERGDDKGRTTRFRC